MVTKSDVRCSYWFCCCCCSVAQLCPVLCDPMDCSTPGSLSFTISQSLLKFMSVEWATLSNHLILCCPLLLPSIFPRIRVFSNESALRIRWPKYWSFSFSISLFNEYSRLIDWFDWGRVWSGLIYWFDLLSVQGIIKTVLQHHNSKASILQCSTFFMVQLLQPYMHVCMHVKSL